MAYLGHKPAVGENNSFRILDDISSFVLTFDGSSASAVGLSDETITITENNHRFITGQRVTYSNGGGGNITGLVNGQAYFVINHSKTQIKLASSASNALAGTAVNLTGLGTGSSHTLTLAFDGVNTKFDPTFGNGMHDTLIKRAAQLVISINGVIQQPHDTATPTTGFGVDSLGHIIFSTAPVSTDIFWGHILASNTVTFDSSDNDVDTFTGNGSTTSFTLSKTPPDNRNILVTIDGVVQYPSDAANTRSYNVSENVMTFTAAPGLGTVIQVRHIGYAGVSGGGGGGVTGFYGRTGNVSLQSTDNIVANNATFSGNVSIAQTLTYEDVTDIDAIGLITARSGINVSGGDVVIANDLDLNGNLDVAGISTFDSAFFPNNKKLKFGNTAASPYTEIVHSPSDNYTDIVAIGGTIRVAAEHISLTRKTAAGTQQFIFCDGDNGGAGIGNVNLYQNGDRKFRTLGNGAQVESATGDTYLNVKAEEDSATADAIFLSRVTNSGASSYLMFGDADDSDVGRIRYNHSNDSLSVKINAVDNRIFVKSDGNIGLGTASPDHNLHVHSSSGDSVITIESTGNGSHSALEFMRTSSGGDSKGAGSIYVTGDTSASAAKMNFGVAYNIGHGTHPRMTIEGVNGRVGIGTDDPTDILDVYSTSDPAIRSRSGSSSVGALMEICGGSSNDSTLFFSSGTTKKYQIFRDGSQSDDLRIYDTTNTLDIMRYRHGGYLHFGVNGEERLRISSTGNVSIGNNATPDTLLHLQGDKPKLRIESTNSLEASLGTEEIGRIEFEAKKGSNLNVAASLRVRQDGTWSTVDDWFSPTAIEFYTQDQSGTEITTPRLTINSDGKVGIATDTGDGLISTRHAGTNQQILHLRADLGSSNGRVLNLYTPDTDNTTAPFRFQTGNGYLFQCDTENVFTIAHDRRIGIGTVNPQLNLHVHQNNSNAAFAHFTNTSTGYNSNQGLSIGLDSDENAAIYHYGSNNIRFATDNTQHMVLRSTGQLGIGTAVNPPADAKKLTVICDSVGDGIHIGNKENLYPAGSTGYSDIRFSFYDYLTGGYQAGGEAIIRGRSHNAYTNSRTTQLIFMTSSDDGDPSSGNATEKVRITHDGDVAVTTRASNNTEGVSKVNVEIPARTTTFAADDGDTWHDILIENPGAATNNAVGLCFQVTGQAYHKNAGTGIAAVKNGTNSDYGSDLVFITRPQSAVAEERLRIASGGAITVGTNGSQGCFQTTGIGAIRDYYDMRNINLEGTTFDYVSNDSDGGGTSWEIKNGSVIRLYSTSGGHGGKWGREVYIRESGYYYWRCNIRLTTTCGAIHNNTSTNHYQYPIMFRFRMHNSGAGNNCKVELNQHYATTGTCNSSQTGTGTLTDGTYVTRTGNAVYLTAGVYQPRYFTNGYLGVRELHIYELALIQAGSTTTGA